MQASDAISFALLAHAARVNATLRVFAGRWAQLAKLAQSSLRAAVTSKATLPLPPSPDQAEAEAEAQVDGDLPAGFGTPSPAPGGTNASAGAR